MQRLKILCLILFLLFASLPHAAKAQTCNNTLIGGLFYGFIAVSVTSLAFAPYSPASPLAAQGNVVITASCTGGLFGGTLPPFTVSLTAGGGSFTQRLMANGAASLKYQIYTSAALSTIWGDGTGSTTTVGGGNNGQTSQMLTGYGQIPPGQYVTPGGYTDNITISIVY
jgi:spore coat protein U-like protein